MQIILWLILLPLAGMGMAAWLYRLPDHGALPQPLLVRWHRLLGRYHHFQQGRYLEAEERECCRARLLGVKVYAVDRHAMVAQRAFCIVTDQRVMIESEQGRHLQLLARDIRAVRAQRTYDPSDGFSYWVVMDRTGSPVRDPEGDVAIQCVGQSESQTLCSTIEAVTSAAAST
jgi:hypothetical protein